MLTTFLITGGMLLSLSRYGSIIYKGYFMSGLTIVIMPTFVLTYTSANVAYPKMFAKNKDAMTDLVMTQNSDFLTQIKRQYTQNQRFYIYDEFNIFRLFMTDKALKEWFLSQDKYVFEDPSLNSKDKQKTQLMLLERELIAEEQQKMLLEAENKLEEQQREMLKKMFEEPQSTASPQTKPVL